MIGRRRTFRKAAPPGAHPRPRLGWQTVSAGEVVAPAELEADTVAVLVRLLEWATPAGVDFESASGEPARWRLSASKGRPPDDSTPGSPRMAALEL